MSKLTVGAIRAMTFADPEVKEVVDFLLKEVDYARQAAIGYATVCISEGMPEEECGDLLGWREEESQVPEKDRLMWFGFFKKKKEKA